MNTQGRLAFGVLAAVIVVGAIVFLTQPQSPVAVTPTTSATPTISSTPTPTPTPMATPGGFVLPEGCSYVGAPVPATPGANTAPYWRFTCGGAPADSLRRVGMALTQQGWATCLPSPGISVYWKGQFSIRLTADNNPSENPVLSQYARDMTACQ